MKVIPAVQSMTIVSLMMTRDSNPAWAVVSPPPADFTPMMRMLEHLASAPWYQGLAGIVLLGVCINVLSAGVLWLLTAGWTRLRRQRGGR